MTRLTCSLFAIFLTGCATTPPPTPPATTVCLPLKAYSATQELALSVEVAALAPSSALVQAMADYGAMRAADRACLGVKP